MGRLRFMVVPLLVAAGVLAYESYKGRLDGEVVVGMAVFLILAAVIGPILYRLDQKQRGA